MQLLEREPFLATLAALSDAAAAGHGRTLLLGGEAGIGKTTLMHHFAAARPRGLRGGCEAQMRLRVVANNTGSLFDDWNPRVSCP